MKYLILNGSPNKNGNTWKLAKQAKEEIQAQDSHAVFDVIHLSDEKLPFCIGCSTCFRLGHDKCPHGKIVLKLIRAVEEADGIIVASSTYFMRETAMLKNMFDHLCFMLHRPHFFASKALVITTTGGIGAKAASKSIVSFLEGIGFNRCYKLSIPAYSWNDYQITEKTKGRLHKTVRRFQQDVSSGKLHSPSFGILIAYNLFRGMSLHYVKGTEFETKDGAFWTDEYRKNSVYEPIVPVPLYKKPFGQLFYLIGKLAGQKIVITYKKPKTMTKEPK